MKLCVDCKHYQMQMRHGLSQTSKVRVDQCHAFDGMQNPVNGEILTAAEAGQMRLTWCGMDAKYFEPKV